MWIRIKLHMEPDPNPNPGRNKASKKNFRTDFKQIFHKVKYKKMETYG